MQVITKQNIIFLMVFIGLMGGINRSLLEAKEETLISYKEKAKQGDAKAQFELGNIYEKGVGVKQDYAEALKWYEKAAKQGHAESQYNLGVVYTEGLGVKQDYAEALKWYEKAADQGYKAAELDVEILRQKMK